MVGLITLASTETALNKDNFKIYSLGLFNNLKNRCKLYPNYTIKNGTKISNIRLQVIKDCVTLDFFKEGT